MNVAIHGRQKHLFPFNTGPLGTCAGVPLAPQGFQQGTHSTYEPRGSKCQKREPRGSIVAGLTPRQTGPFRYYSEEGRLRGLGTRKTREAITRFEGRFPEIFKSIEPVLYQIGTRHGCVALEAELEETTAQLSRLDLNLTLDDQALKDFAEAKSRSCAKQCKAFGYTERTENHIKQILDGYALPYPKPKGSSVQSRLKRTEDSKWWRRSVRKPGGQFWTRQPDGLVWFQKTRCLRFRLGL